MKNFKLFTLVLIILVNYQCTTEKDDFVQEPLQQKISAKLLTKIENLGYDINRFPPVLTDDGATVIIERDMLISLKKLKEASLEKQSYNRAAGLLSCGRAREIRVRNNLRAGGAPRRAVSRAINLWNRVSNSNVRFVVVTSGRIDLRIVSASLPDGEFPVIADAFLPEDGRIGGQIRVDETTRTFNNRILTQRQWSNVIAHELGHAIGFIHDEESGVRIPGTPNTNITSIMSNRERIGAPNSVENLDDISGADKRAIRRMYGGQGNRLCRNF